MSEVLVGLLEGDPQSYLSQAPTWRPHELLPDRDDFTMADLVRFTVPGEGGPPADDAGAPRVES